jgi:hypothetical protein
VYYFNANSHLIHPNEWAQLIQRRYTWMPVCFSCRNRRQKQTRPTLYGVHLLRRMWTLAWLFCGTPRRQILLAPSCRSLVSRALRLHGNSDAALDGVAILLIKNGWALCKTGGKRVSLSLSFMSAGTVGDFLCVPPGFGVVRLCYFCAGGWERKPGSVCDTHRHFDEGTWAHREKTAPC